MNAIEHQATVDKGLKMKIKRKNISGGSPKNTDLPKAGGTEPASGCTANGNSTNGSSAALDKLKQTLAADKERYLNNSKQQQQQQQQQATSGTTTMTNGAPTPSARSGPPGCNKRACKDSKVVVMVNKDGTTGGTAVPAGTTAVTSGTGEANGGATSGANGGANGATSGSVAELSKSGTAMNAVKKECLSTGCNSSTTTTTSDPYEFNAKVEDRIGLPVKKIKIEKLENPTSPGATHSDMDLHDIGTETCSVAIATDPDCLGPCEPGTSVVLEGIVWNETENGILVVNVTWRGKTYVGTLMDTTKHAWAPPRLNCDSPANEEGTHTPRGRGKRGGRNAVTPPVVELGERRLRKRRTNNNNPYAATAPSPAKSDVLGGIKRRGRPTDFDLSLDNLRQIKRPRVAKNGVVNHHHGAVTLENGFIECPEPNCMKKYKHINGLKYHQAHAHKKYCTDDQEQESPDSNKRATPDGADEDERVFQDLPSSPSAWCQSGAKKEATGGGAGGASTEQDFKSDGAKGKKSARKEDKIDARKLAKRPTVELTPVSVDAKTGAYPSTVSSPGSVTTVSVLPSTAGTRCTATTSITTMPITTATTSSSGDKVKKSKADKKNKHRLQQMAPASGLKPIQPRPTVLGETGSVNPLVGLKEKKSKKKKNKDKDKDREHRGSSEKSAEHKTKDAPKPAEVCASSASELSVSLGGSKPLEALAKMSTPPELQKQANLSPPELQKQPSLVSTSPALMKAPDARPPSSLSLNSPVADTGASESKDQNTNAQSPAYSDISDANDSSTNLDADTGTAATSAATAAIKKEPQLQERHSGQDGAMKTGATPSSVTCGGGGDHVPQNYHASVYHAGYYPPHSYQSPSTSSPQHQTSRDGRTGGGGGGGGGGCAAPSASKPQGKESDKCLKSGDAGKKAEHRDGKDPSKAAAPKASPSPVQIREYQEQMLRAQQMAQYQQYLGAYGYGVDVRALASNPEYKAQYEWMMEQERVRREYLAEHQKLTAGKSAESGAGGGGGGGGNKPKAHDPSRPLDLNTKAMDLSKQGKSSPSPRSNATVPPSGVEQYKQTEGMTSKAKDNSMAPTSDSKGCDSSKEAKSHVDHRGGAGAGVGASYPPGFDRCQEEYKRYFMYQQQHLLEQKHYMDGADSKQTPPSPHHRDTASATTHSMTPSPHHQHQSSGSYPREAMSSGTKIPSHPTQHQEYRQTEAKSDKDRCKTSTSTAPPASNSLPPSPAGKLKDSAPYGQYYSHSGYAGYPGYEQLGYSQNHIMLGYVSGSSNYSTPSPYSNKSRCQSPALATKGSSLPEGAKALELLQQKAANYYNSQSPQSQHPKHPAVKDNPKPDKASSDRQSQDRVGLDWVGPERTGADHPDQRNKDKEHDHKSPPPTQRHIHTHHHTHLVGPAYPLYGSYSAFMASQKATAAAAAAAVSYGPTK